MGASPTTIVRDSSQCAPSTEAERTTKTGSPCLAWRAPAGACTAAIRSPTSAFPAAATASAEQRRAPSVKTAAMLVPLISSSVAPARAAAKPASSPAAAS